MKTVSVIPLKKGIFKDDLTYFSTKDIPDGSIVTVLVRNKKTLGLTTSSEDVKDIKSEIKGLNFDLKKIIEVKGKSVFQQEFLNSALLTSQYFVSQKSSTITSLIPATFRDNYDRISNLKQKINLPIEDGAPKFSRMKSEKLLFQASFDDRISYYKTLIRESFARKKSIFLVLPTEYDVKNFSEILSKGIENFIVSLHGGLSNKKQIEGYEKIVASDHPLLILGTAPYLIIPRNDIETIILEKENSTAYKTMNNTHIDLRVFVEIFSTKKNARLIFSDTILRFETISRKNKDDFGEVHPMSFRVNFDGEIVFPKKEGKFKIFDDTTVQEMRDYISKRRNIFIFSLRKGLATLTLCHDCNEPVLCEECSSPVVLYLSRDNTKRMFVCNKCKKEKTPETTCKNCGSWNLVPLGIGTDTVSEEIKKILSTETGLPEIKIFKLDKESAKTTAQAEKIINDFEKTQGGILVGTEMALFYLKNKMPLSIIASFDSLWSIPSFKMSEKIIQIVLSIISKTEKKIIIETKNYQDSILLSIKNENLLSFLREELEDRKTLDYPPYRRFIKITHIGDKEQTANAKRVLRELLNDFNLEVFSGFVAKQKNKYVTNALVKISPQDWSLPELSLNSKINENLFKKLKLLNLNFSIIVDPEDLL